MILEIQKYIEISNSIDEILKNSPFKLKYIIEKSGISEPTFFRKMREKRFTADELLKIAEVVDPAEKFRLDTKTAIQQGLEDVKNGQVIPHEKVMKEAKARIQKKKDELGLV